MIDALGPGTVLGYCTNVHAGATLADLEASLNEHAVEVKRLACPDHDLPVGLWLSGKTIEQIRAPGFQFSKLQRFLSERGLSCYTINGFPHGDFQNGSVKRSVYRPNWTEAARIEHTMFLCAFGGALASEVGGPVSISTLPLGWHSHLQTTDDQVRAAMALLWSASSPASGATDEGAPGRSYRLAIEPEPGCVVQSCEDVVRLFGLGWAPAPVRKHFGPAASALAVCHDVCHASVMFEDQRATLHRYALYGVSVAKVQISAGLRVRFDEFSPTERQEARRQLQHFAEGRYLHQTMVRDDAGRRTFYEDLPIALEAAGEEPRGEWRVHYHVPVFLERIGLLETTSDEIPAAVRAARELHQTRHFEIETYAWPVLPEGVWSGSVNQGVAEELKWVTRNAPMWLGSAEST